MARSIQRMRTGQKGDAQPAERSTAAPPRALDGTRLPREVFSMTDDELARHLGIEHDQEMVEPTADRGARRDGSNGARD